MADILIIGEILVEVMATQRGQSFEEVGFFEGPFASGAPAIFIDQVAKTGSSCAIVSKVGDDSFGKLSVRRLQRDGVSVRYIDTVPGKTTGIAFVTYDQNGGRSFIFTLNGSAYSVLKKEDVREDLFEDCNFYHIMGCSVFNEQMVEVFAKAVEIAKARKVQISFDPNLRFESMRDEKVKQFIRFVAENCDYFFPGEDELKWIAGMANEAQAAQYFLERNAKCVAVKKGARGSRVYHRNGYFDVAPFKTEEIDPTGAGDCYAGTFISLLNQGRTIREAAIYASASGALAVSRKGPMEGTATLQELDDFIKRQSGQPV